MDRDKKTEIDRIGGWSMTEREICYMYRNARNKNTQLQILAELNDVNRIEIIRILAKNGEKLTPRVVSLA